MRKINYSNNDVILPNLFLFYLFICNYFDHFFIPIFNDQYNK